MSKVKICSVYSFYLRLAAGLNESKCSITCNKLPQVYWLCAEIFFGSWLCVGQGFRKTLPVVCLWPKALVGMAGAGRSRMTSSLIPPAPHWNLSLPDSLNFSQRGSFRAANCLNQGWLCLTWTFLHWLFLETNAALYELASEVIWYHFWYILLVTQGQFKVTVRRDYKRKWK